MSVAASGSPRWSSGIAFYLGTVGAAVGLGSIWRFPYLVGTHGGSVFIFAFLLAILLIATPLLVAEFIIGRRSRRNPLEAAGELASREGGQRGWNTIGWLGSLAAFIIVAYYMVIAGWVLAYAWKFASGALTDLEPGAAAAHFEVFVNDPFAVGSWHLLFLCLTAWICARGLKRGIEAVSFIRAPALLTLLLILVGYSLTTGNVASGLAFAFVPDLSKLNAGVALAAVGQAFYATGVGMAMMIAYGAYVPRETSLTRSALIISGSIVLVSILATLMIFPMVYRYGINPAAGSELVFRVLPALFAEMPAGRLVGSLFFLLLVFAALTPSIACFEPVVAWLQQRLGMTRQVAVAITAISAWALGIGSVYSLKFLETSDFISSNLMLPAGALLASILIGWRLDARIVEEELFTEQPYVRRLCRMSLRYVCPIAIASVFAAALG